MKIAHINANGLKQIVDALGQYHKLGRDHFTKFMLNTWVSDAEENFNNGNCCYFEISSIDSNSGAPVEVFITSDGYDVEDL